MAEQHTSSFPVPALCDLPQRVTKDSHKEAHKTQKKLNRNLFCDFCAFLWLDFFRGLADFNRAALNDLRVDAAQAECFSQF